MCYFNDNITIRALKNIWALQHHFSKLVRLVWIFSMFYRYTFIFGISYIAMEKSNFAFYILHLVLLVVCLSQITEFSCLINVLICPGLVLISCFVLACFVIVKHIYLNLSIAFICAPLSSPRSLEILVSAISVSIYFSIPAYESSHLLFFSFAANLLLSCSFTNIVSRYSWFLVLNHLLYKAIFSFIFVYLFNSIFCSALPVFSLFTFYFP